MIHTYEKHGFDLRAIFSKRLVLPFLKFILSTNGYFSQNLQNILSGKMIFMEIPKKITVSGPDECEKGPIEVLKKWLLEIN